MNAAGFGFHDQEMSPNSLVSPEIFTGIGTGMRRREGGRRMGWEREAGREGRRERGKEG